MLKIPEIIIEPDKPMPRMLQEIWEYRELFLFLAWRNLLVRYKQATIGIIWGVLGPLLTVIVFTLIFSRLANLPSFGVPYPVLILAGMLPWQFFSSTVAGGSESLIADSNLISKVYFPRLIIPTSTILVGIADLGVSLVLLLLMMSFYRIFPGWQIVFIPFMVILMACLSLGIGYFVAALNVRYRDFRYLVSFFIQMGFYFSPVAFSARLVPEHLRMWYFCNPVAGLIEGFRWCFFGNIYKPYWPGVFLSGYIAIMMFMIGTRYFLKNERKFADVI